MSPPPLGPHNHSQTHLKLSGRLPLQALVSADLHTTKFSYSFMSMMMRRLNEATDNGTCHISKLKKSMTENNYQY